MGIWGSTRLRRPLVGVAVVVLTAVALAAGTAAAPPAQAVVTTPSSGGVGVVGTQFFRGVACLRVFLECLGIGVDDSAPLGGGNPTVVPISLLQGPAGPVAVPGMSDLLGIACFSALSCIGVGDTGQLGGSFQAQYVLLTAFPPPGVAVGATTPVPGLSSLSSVSCPSATECVAAGIDGIATLDPTTGAVSVTPVPGLGAAASVACASVVRCLVAGWDGALGDNSTVRTFDPTTSTVGAPQPVPGAVRSLACPTLTCEAAVAVGLFDANNSVVVPVDAMSGTAGTAAALPPFDVAAIACPAANRCLAAGARDVGAYPNDRLVPTFSPIVGGVPGAAVPSPALGGSDGVSGVACVANRCIAVGSTAPSGGPGVQATGMVLPLTVAGQPLRFIDSGRLTSQRQVVDATVGQPFDATMAVFSDTNPWTQAGEFQATIDWGDGTAPTAGVVVGADPGTCQDEQLPAGPCYRVTGNHTFSSSDRLFTPHVTIVGLQRQAAVTDVAEVQAAGGTPAVSGAPAGIGVLVKQKADGTLDTGGSGCTATALENTDIVVTAHHCNNNWSGTFQFAPGHTGTCGGTISRVCPTNPFGVFVTNRPGVQVGNSDIEFLIFDRVDPATGMRLKDNHIGLPPVFSHPYGTYRTYGYPVRVGDWSLRSCAAMPVQQGPTGLVILPACDYTYPDGRADGVSGAPWTSNDVVPDGVGVINQGICARPDQNCSQYSNVSPPFTAGNALGFAAMDVFAALALVYH